MASQFCAGMTGHSAQDAGRCAKHSECALYRHWWEQPGTDMHLCAGKKFNRFVPINVVPLGVQKIQSMPVGKNMELFA